VELSSSSREWESSVSFRTSRLVWIVEPWISPKKCIVVINYHWNFIRFWILKCVQSVICLYLCCHWRSNYQEGKGCDPINWFNSHIFVNQSLYYYFIMLWKESLGNNGQQFHQYQQNQQHFSLQIIEHSKDHNAWGSQLESQVLAMDRHKNVTVKPVNGITSLPLLIIGSPMATQI
jgi:hypothetical protein